MKTIKLAYVGWWDTFDIRKNLIFRILCKYYNVQICEASEAEYSICSLYTKDYLDAPGVRIFYTAEALVPDFNLFDYAIGFDEIEFGDRYVRVPNYIMNLKYKEDINQLQNRVPNDMATKFCGWVCSNGNGDKVRDEIFDALSKYKRVDSAGRYRNNLGIQERIPDKRAFQKEYKFTLAVENTSYKGYTTEKLIEAFAAGGIPIYWGDPDVGAAFNTKSFVNIMDYASLDEAVDYVKKLDQNDYLYREMRNQEVLVNQEHFATIEEKLETFLLNIFEQPLDKAYRRPYGQTAKRHEEIIRKGNETPRKSKGFINRYFKN